MLDTLIDAFLIPIRMAVWLAFLVFLTFTALALAADAQLAWQPPTEYVDGTPLPASDLRETVAQWTACDGTWPSSGAQSTLTVPMPGTTAKVNGLDTGTYCFRVAAVTVAGSQSEWSNVAVKVVAPPPPPPQPKPPVIITIDIQARATLETAADGSLRLTVR